MVNVIVLLLCFLGHFFRTNQKWLDNVCFPALGGSVCLVYFIQHVIGLFDCLRAFWLIREINLVLTSQPTIVKRKLVYPSFRVNKSLNMPLRNKIIIFHTLTCLDAALSRTIEMWCVNSYKVCTCGAWFLWSFHIRKMSVPQRVRYPWINLLGT